MFGTAKIAVKRAFSTRTFQAIIMVISAITVITTSTLLSIKTVTVKENGATLMTTATFSGTVEKFINASGIVVGEFDKVSPPMLSTLKKNQEINITRAYPLNISVGGQVQTVMAADQTVAEILEVNNITMDSMDIISPSLDSVVNKNTQITITKVTSDMVPVQEEIAFTIIQTPNSNLDRGVTRVVQEGKAGTKEVMYNVTYSNGQELSRQAAGERIVTEPVNKIVEYGTKYASVSRGGNVSRVTDPSTQLNYTKSITVTATAYDLSYASCGKNPGDRGYGITASGMKAARGVIAVDPRVIPMGSKLYIESLDGSADYGYAIAGDKGGAIKGNRIDLFMDTHAEAIRWGRRSVKVYILAD